MESRREFYLGTMTFGWKESYEEVNKGILSRLRNDGRTNAPVYKLSTDTSTEYSPFLMKNDEYENPQSRKNAIDRIHRDLDPQPVSINVGSGEIVKQREYEIRNARIKSGYPLALNDSKKAA